VVVLLDFDDDDKALVVDFLGVQLFTFCFLLFAFVSSVSAIRRDKIE
jgi:hypothetical protein